MTIMYEVLHWGNEAGKTVCSPYWYLIRYSSVKTDKCLKHLYANVRSIGNKKSEKRTVSENGIKWNNIGHKAEVVTAFYNNWMWLKKRTGYFFPLYVNPCLMEDLGVTFLGSELSQKAYFTTHSSGLLS